MRPSFKISWIWQVGDYGTMDRETGNFQKEGNIYENKTIAYLTDEHKPLTGAPDNKLIISSAGVIHRELNVGADWWANSAMSAKNEVFI